MSAQRGQVERRRCSTRRINARSSCWKFLGIQRFPARQLRRGAHRIRLRLTFFRLQSLTTGPAHVLTLRHRCGFPCRRPVWRSPAPGRPPRWDSVRGKVKDQREFHLGAARGRRTPFPGAGFRSPAPPDGSVSWHPGVLRLPSPSRREWHRPRFRLLSHMQGCFENSEVFGDLGNRASCFRATATTSRRNSAGKPWAY